MRQIGKNLRDQQKHDKKRTEKLININSSDESMSDVETLQLLHPSSAHTAQRSPTN